METGKKTYSEEVDQKRVEYVDAIKGIGIILVIIGHHLLDSEAMIMWINSFHMPLFFIVSGYLMEYNKTKDNQVQKLCGYALKRAKTIVYPYLTLSSINLLWYLLFHTLLGFAADESLRQVLLKTVTTFGYHALWFLPCMYFVSVASKWMEKNIVFSNRGQVVMFVCAGGDCMDFDSCDAGARVLEIFGNLCGQNYARHCICRHW